MTALKIVTMITMPFCGLMLTIIAAQKESTTAAPAAPMIHQTPMSISYDEAARFPTQYLNKAVIFSGKVVQVLNEGGGTWLMRVVVAKDKKYDFWDYKKIVILRYRDPLKSDGRILENDVVEFRGIFEGIQSYTAVLGQKIEVPGVAACDIRVISNPNPRAPRDCT